MAQALCDWASDPKKRPGGELLRSINPALGKRNTNLGIMSNVLGASIGVVTWRFIHGLYRESLYGPAFRTEFEGMSVSYHGYRSLADLNAMLYGPDDVAELARESLRWDLTVQILCATLHGSVIMPCGRIYAYDRDRDGDKDGVTSAEADFRVRAVLGIGNDGWWPPKGINEKKYWSDPASVDARPWRGKGGERLASLIFSDDERATLKAWVLFRAMTPGLRELVDPIRLAQVLHVAPRKDGHGHVAWMENLNSYDDGDNTAQPFVVAAGDRMEGCVLSESPCGVLRHEGAFYFTSPEFGGVIEDAPEIDEGREIVIPRRGN